MSAGRPFWRRSFEELPPGWRWAVWALWAAVSSLPVVFGDGRDRFDDVMASAAIAGILALPYLILQVRDARIPGGVFLLAAQCIPLLLFGLILDGGRLLGTAAILFGVLDLILALGWLWRRTAPMSATILYGTVGLLFLGFGMLAGGGIPRAQYAADATACANNLKQIGAALEAYRADQGCYPSDAGPGYLQCLGTAGYLPDARVFCCRSGREKLGGDSPVGYEPNPALAGKGAEAYRVPDPASVPWVWDRQPFHFKGRVRRVLFLDGATAVMKEPAFQAMLARSPTGGGNP